MIPVPVDFPVLQSETAVVLNLGDEKNGRSRVLYEKDADKELPVASLTKMMTALLVLEKVAAGEMALAEKVTVTPEMLTGLEEFAVVGLATGQIWTVEDLLYAAMLPSAGDAAQALAVAASGTLEKFVAEMNERAGKMGMERTQFSNAVGFDAENYSTARDMARLLKGALRNKEFVKVFATEEYYLPELAKTVKKTVTTTAGKQGIDISMLTGAKTGFTYAAGRCLASTATVGEGATRTDLLMVNLGADYRGAGHIKDPVAVYEYLGENYSYRVVKAAGETVWKLPVENSPMAEYEVKAPEEVRVYLPNGLELGELKYEWDGAEAVKDGTEKGEKLGVVTVKWGEQKIYTTEVALDEEIYYYNWPLYIGVGAGVVVVVFVGVTFGRRNMRKRKLGHVKKA